MERGNAAPPACHGARATPSSFSLHFAKRGEMERRSAQHLLLGRALRHAAPSGAPSRRSSRASVPSLDYKHRSRVIGCRAARFANEGCFLARRNSRYLPIPGRASTPGGRTRIHVSQLLAGGHSTSGRSPDAARVPVASRQRGRRTSGLSRHRSIGAASPAPAPVRPAITTPHESAPRWTRWRNISKIEECCQAEGWSARR